MVSVNFKLLHLSYWNVNFMPNGDIYSVENTKINNYYYYYYYYYLQQTISLKYEL